MAKVLNIGIGGNSGITPSVTFTSENFTSSGSVTLDGQGASYNAIWNGTDFIVTGIASFGTYTYTANQGQKTKTGTVVVDTIAAYTVNVKFTKIYGISKSYTDGGTSWSRTDNSLGLTATASVGTVGYSSDFDNAYPWSEMKRETLSTGDIMVKIPKFWYKRYRDGNTEYIKIADGEKEGFTLHPLFKPSNIELDYVYIGAYETSSGHYSKNGYSPLVNTTRAGFRNGASSKGSGWSQFDISSWSAIQLLYLVEFANNNSQASVGRGYCDGNSSALSTGSCDSLYSANCYSGRPSGTDGKTSVMYRGIENPWGNIWKWVDGINWNNGAYYICTNPSNYADDTSNNYTQLSYTGGSTSYSSSYISQEGLDTNNSWILMPTSAGGSESTFMCDAIWSSTGWRVCRCGGWWGNGSSVGLFAVDVIIASSSSLAGIGGRLLYRPV